MKKTITSIVILMAVLISAFAVFTIPASAVSVVQTITPNDQIELGTNDDYYEAIFSGYTVGTTYNIPLYIAQSGYRIIQTFGNKNYRWASIKILDSEGNPIASAPQGFSGYGYGNNSLVNYYFEAGMYSISITPRRQSQIRLSITLADNYFDVLPPISNYEDITEYFSVEETFTIDTTAKVWLLEFDENDDALDGIEDGYVGISAAIYTEQYAEGYILNPNSSAYMDGIYVEADNLSSGELSDTILVPINVPYYVVLMTRWGGEGDWNTVVAQFQIFMSSYSE